jgi:hypothetical protein
MGAAAPGGSFGDAGVSPDVGGPADTHASWRDPALESWQAAYRLAQPTSSEDKFPVRRWVLGGAAAMVIAGVAAWFAFGALGGGTSPSYRGGVVTDHAAGISFTIPAGPRWTQVTKPGYGFTTMTRTPAPGTGSSGPQHWAVAATEPLPTAIAYHGAADLRADGLSAAATIARRYFPSYHGNLGTVIRRQPEAAGRPPAYVATFRIPGDSGKAAQPSAVVIVGQGSGQRPGLLFVTVPASLSARLVGQITATARPVSSPAAPQSTPHRHHAAVRKRKPQRR